MSWTVRQVVGMGGLSQAEMDDNAREVRSHFNNWTLNAVCGMLGNMVQESGINPGAWQIAIDNTRGGFGLVQWTPGSKVIDWCNSQSISYLNGENQCIRIDYEKANGLQYYQTTAFPMSFTAYTQSTETPEYLAEAWLKNYERAGVAALTTRQQWARYYYDLLEGETPEPPDPPQPEPPTPVLPIWIMKKRRRF